MMTAMPDLPVRPTMPRGRRRLWVAATLGVVWGLLMGLGSGTPMLSWILRTTMVVLFATAAFTLCERWPATLPRWIARWVLQLLAVVVAIPLAAFIAYSLTTSWPFWAQTQRLQGFAIVTFLGILVGPWIALAAMVRQREALAHHQALALDLARSEIQRQSLEARMQLMQAQVQPHFLFNTLANVRALVNTGSPNATRLLDSLIAYLRGAVPRLDDPVVSLECEAQLVRSYLDIMQMRMPDRLQYAVHVDPAALQCRCPPMTVLTLVENAVRHGIDPSENGGRIDVVIRLHEGRCRVEVTDTGVGLGTSRPGLGTGLTALRERLALAFDGGASLRLGGTPQGGACAELDFPADPASPSACAS